MEPITITPTPKPSGRQKLIRYLLYGITGIAIAIILLFTYWLLQSSQVLEVKNSPFPVRPPVVSRDGVIFVHVNYCKSTDVHGMVVLRLVGKRSIIRIPSPDDTQGAQCIDREIPMPVPSYATDDVYYFDFAVTYQINPLKSQVVNMRSQEFTVESPK